MHPFATAAHTTRVSALALALTWSLSAVASPPAADVAASDRVHVLRSMAARGELDAVDSARLTDEAMRLVPDGKLQPPSSALSFCSMLARFEARAWAHERGGNLAYPTPPHEGFVESETLPLRVYYETSWDKPMAQDALAYAEAAWKDLVDEQGFPAPFTDDDDGQPIQGMWLYVADAGMGGGGYTEPLSDVPSTAVSDCSSRVVVDSVNPSDYVEETVYHEMVHTTQMATDCAEAISAFENFASAGEHLHNPYAYTYAYGFLPEFQAWPDYPVDYWTMNAGDYGQPLNYYQYGAGLFPIFLVDRFGDRDPAFLNTIWQTFAQEGTVTVTSWKVTNDKGNHPNWFEGVHALLQKSGSTFNEGFREFVQWRTAVGGRYDPARFQYGFDYPGPAVAASLYGATPAQGDLRMREYGSQFVDYSPGSYRGGLRFTVTVTPTTTWAADLILWHGSSPPEVVPFVFEGVEATVEVLSVDGLSGITLAVSQLKDAFHIPDLMDYKNERQASYTMELISEPEAGPEPTDADAGPLVDAGEDAPGLLDQGGAAIDPTAYEAGGGGCGCRASSTAPARGLIGAAMLGMLLAARKRRRRRA